jgi:hypothetical protein
MTDQRARPSSLDVEPGGEARFAVEAGLRRSVDWRAWTSKNFDDVYVAARSAAGYIKVSLHQSGSWQHGFISDEAALCHTDPGSSRHFSIWARPPEIAQGWTLAMKIVVPLTELQVREATETAKKPVVIIQAPDREQFNTVIVEVWLESPGSPRLNLASSQLVARLRQAGGGNVWVVSRPFLLPWDPGQRFEHEVNDARDAAVALVGWSGQEPLSVCIHDPTVPGGELILCEVAVPPPADEPPADEGT